VNHSFQSLGVSNVPIHIFSPRAKESLELCNILGEWMNTDRQQTVFKSRMPLIHSELIATKHLSVHSRAFELIQCKGSCVVFLGDSSFEFEDVEFMVMEWMRDPRCHFILTGKFYTNTIQNQTLFFTNVK
jgi:hypothetical protein